MLGKTPGPERVLLWDDLEGLFKWTTVPGWGVPRRSKSSSAAFGGSWGLELLVRRRVPDGFQYVGAGRTFPLVRDAVVRFESVMMCPGVNGQDGFGIAVQWYDGTNKYDVRVAYEGITDYFMWFRPGCTWGDSGLRRDPRAKGAWHRVWMEIDLVRKEYKNVGIDGDVVQLDGNKICAVPDAGPVVAYVILFVVVLYSGTRSGYFDDVFVGAV